MSGLTGRFLTRDPIGYIGGANLSEFIGGHAFDGVDPTGLIFEPPLTPNSYPRWFQVPPYPSPPTGYPVVNVGPVKHSTSVKRCIFKMRGTNTGPDNYPPGTVYPVNEVDEDLGMIPEIIRRMKCCEIVFFGHQGGSSNPGGTVSYPPGDGDRIVVLPNEELEKQIKQALKDAGCKSCKLFTYSCSSENVNEVDKVRLKIASNTGCDVYGLRGEPFKASGSPQNHTANCEKWPKEGEWNGCQAPDMWKWPAW
jgi:hypothetical protein